MKKINLGCGAYKKKECVNLDVNWDCRPDIVANLEVIPYPFKENTFDCVEADHVLEHLSAPFEVMQDIFRILKPGGKLIIRVPHFSRAMTHPQHKRGFDVTFPLYFNKDFTGGYTGVEYTCERIRLRWFAQRRLMKDHLSVFTYYALSVLGCCIDFFANISPMVCSRIWCFWVGGFYEIEFVFRKPENI
jgi:SAM-dependent methyltransferase